MKKYTDQELNIIRSNNKPYGMPLNDFEIASLVSGEASIQVQTRADRILEKYQKMMRSPISKKDALANFLTRGEHAQADHKIDERITNLTMELIGLREALIKKKIVSTSEILQQAIETEALGIESICINCHVMKDKPKCDMKNWNMEGIVRFVDKYRKNVHNLLQESTREIVIECKHFREVR